jgi:hypothetical protein
LWCNYCKPEKRSLFIGTHNKVCRAWCIKRFDLWLVKECSSEFWVFSPTKLGQRLLCYTWFNISTPYNSFYPNSCKFS